MNKFYVANEDSILYFLHIPKTAGVSFISFLDDCFDEDKILPQQTWHKLLPELPIDFEQYNLIRGHFGYGIHHRIKKNLIYITFLREPIKRAISNFNHYKRNPGIDVIKLFNKMNSHSDFKCLRPDDEFAKKLLWNNQCRYLTKDIDVIQWYKNTKKTNFFNELNEQFMEKESEHQLLERAKKNLSKFNFYGITERFTESLQLFCFIFGIKYHNNKKLNVSTEKEKITTVEKKKIEEYNKLDIQLYKLAVNEFDKRYQNMLNFLTREYGSKRSRDTQENIEKLLDIHFEKMLSLQKAKSGLYYTMKNPLYGNGWYQRETDSKTNKKFRWSGPENESTLYFPKLVQKKNYKITIVLRKTFLKIEDDWKFFINDKYIELHQRNKLKNTKICEGYFSGDICKGGKIIKLKFETSKTMQPNKIIPKINDNRKLGIALEKLIIKEIDEV